jgi:two-component system chemotaxis response regulator CheB
MAPVRVLVVDDSVVVRRLVTRALEADGVEVVGVAANGRIALAKIAQHRPDVVTLDIEMPEMDGLATLREIRREWPRLPVVMFSTLTERGATATLDALTLGASDYVTKPSGVKDTDEAIAVVRAELVPKVKALAAKAGNGSAPAPAAGAGSRLHTPTVGTAPRLRPAGIARPTNIEVLAIGCSTGGPNALAALLPALPAPLPVPVVIVQHMPPVFTRFLADRLNAHSDLNVKEAEEGDRLEAGCAYIAPGGLHMAVEVRAGLPTVLLHEGPPENSCRPAVDVLFRSVAAVFGANVLGCVLTGMGQDGLRGAEVIADAGGRLVVQDSETSVVWGMPGFVAGAGLADAILPLSEIGDELGRRILAGRRPAVSSLTPTHAIGNR